MLHELESQEFNQALLLFQELNHNLVIESVIAGNTRGRIWVDHPNHPTAALLWNLMDALLVAGNPQNQAFTQALNQLIITDPIPDAQRRLLPGFSVHYSEAWEAQMNTLLAGLPVQKGKRHYYVLDQPRIDWRTTVGPGLIIRPVDIALLADEGWENRRQVIGWIRSFWPSLEDFAARGIGYCLTDGHIITSWCLSVFVCDRRYELGLETATPYRSKGHATLTAAACVQHCLEHELTPFWHCWANNRPSVTVAKKVGFRKHRDYEVYQFQFEDMR